MGRPLTGLTKGNIDITVQRINSVRLKFTPEEPHGAVDKGGKL